MNQSSLENPIQIIYFEDVLPRTGWGLYYKFMLGMACACCFANACASLSIYFAVPISSCAWSIPQDLLYGVNIAEGIGRATFGSSLNCMYDNSGRKKYITYSLMTIFMSSFTAAFSYNYYIVMLAIFFLAAGLECNRSVVKVHLAETLPQDKRGYYLSFCDIFWYLGYLATGLFAVFVHNPNRIEGRVVDMRIATWRLMFAICGGMHLLLACSAALLEESPRFFLFAKKTFLALLILKQFYAVNKSSYGESFPVKEENLRYVIDDYTLPHIEEPIGYRQHVSLLGQIVRKSIGLLFSRLLLKSTALITIINANILMLSSLDLNILLAKAVTSGLRVENGLDITFLEPRRDGIICRPWSDYKDLYFNFFIISLNILMGKLLMMFLLDRIRRNINLGLCIVVCGICSLMLQLLVIGSSMSRMFISSILLLAHSGTATILHVVAIESFPTALRGTSYAITNTLGIILSVMFIRLLHFYSKWIFLIMSILYIGSATAATFLTDLRKLPMVE